MQKSILYLATLLLSFISYSQEGNNNNFISNTIKDTRFVHKTELPTVYLNENTNVLFRLPETIQFIDLSGNNLIGDIPVQNVARVKIAEAKKPFRNLEEKLENEEEEAGLEVLLELNNYKHNEEIGIVTITAESFMTQYKVVYVSPEYSTNIVTNVEVLPENMFPLEYPKYDLNRNELRHFSMQALKEKGNKIRRSKNAKMKMIVNNIFVVGEFFFIDVTVTNKTNIPYTIDDFKFSINDKKIYKATNTQSVEIKPLYSLYNSTIIKRKFRNVFVFRKFTFHNKKRFNIRLIEEQISGRTIDVDIKYKDILSADKL